MLGVKVDWKVIANSSVMGVNPAFSSMYPRPPLSWAELVKKVLESMINGVFP